MTKPILVFSTETVGANTFSSADVGYFLASFQPFNTHWNSKAKVSSQHTCSKGQYQLEVGRVVLFRVSGRVGFSFFGFQLFETFLEIANQV